MKRYIAVVLAVMIWSAISGAAELSAQVASSFEQLQVLVKAGDKVEILGADGTSTKGQIVSLTPASLRLATNGRIRDYDQKDALVVKQKRGDSIWNGAVIGAASGAGFGLVSWIGSGGCDCTAGEIASYVGVSSALGAGIGMSIDALIRHHKTIYNSPVRSTSSRIGVAPLIAGGRKGVALRISFK